MLNKWRFDTSLVTLIVEEMVMQIPEDDRIRQEWEELSDVR